MTTDKELLELAAKAAGKKERHGMRWTPEYQSWIGMKQRCTNPKKRDYLHYGGRGIKVCKEWMDSFVSFYRHIGKRPSENHSIDRIDVNGNYEPGNVRWATSQEQNENTRVVRMVTINGKTQSLAAWGREMGLPSGQINGRLKAGWSIEEAVLSPSVPGQKKHMRVQRGYSTYERDRHGRYKKAAAIGKSL